MNSKKNGSINMPGNMSSKDASPVEHRKRLINEALGSRTNESPEEAAKRAVSRIKQVNSSNNEKKK